MPLHLLKLCVGVDTIAELQAEIAARQASGLRSEQVHTTRMTPKRASEIVDGGSLFWVIRGQVAARQPVCAIRPFVAADGVSRCHLVLEPSVVPVLSRPCRPFQGWRYLAAEAAPADLSRVPGTEAMPEALRHALRDLCLI